jgi:hypothetical protein
MALAVTTWLENLVTVGGVFALFGGLVFGTLWLWNR